MFILILFLAIVVVVLWSRVHHHSSSLTLLDSRIDLLEKRAAEMMRAMEELKKGWGPRMESAPPPVQTTVPERPKEAAPSLPTPPVPEIKPAKPEPVSMRHPMPVPKPAEASLPPSRVPNPPAERVTSRQLPRFDWESLVGVKLFSWIAGIALLLAAVFFLRYSINQGWLGPQVRMAIGIAVGIGLLAMCELKAARKYPVTANAMDASALAILFSTFYAARALWDLIGPVPAFLLMAVVTGLAVLLSIRRDSIFIALLGLLGGFATPALLSTGENRPISLFTYLVLLNAGLAYIAGKKKWPLLTTLSLAFTVIYQWGWVIKFLTASQLPTALGIFVIFPILAFAMSAFSRKEETSRGWMNLYGHTSSLTALLPLLFTLYLAAVPAYGERYVLLFGFLFLLDAGLFAIAAARSQGILHLTGGLSTILVSAIWLSVSYTGEAWPAILVFLSLFVIFYLTAPLLAEHLHGSLSGKGAWAVYAAPLLLFMAPGLAIVEPACSNPWPLFGIVFLLILAISGYAIVRQEGPVYYVAAFFALMAQAAWSVRHLEPERLISAMILFGAFGILYVGIPVLANRLKKKLRPEAPGMCLLLLSIALMVFLAAPMVAKNSIWGLALLLLFLNAGLFYQNSLWKLPAMTIAGIALSWIILGILWSNVSIDEVLGPALAVVTAFACFVIAANLWLQKRAPASAPPNGILLGLTGHLFLFIVAARTDLSVPPWPFFCVLFTLDLTIGFAALYLRRNGIHQAAMAASALLLMVWVGNNLEAPWPRVAILASGALTLFGLILAYLANRRGGSSFSRTAAATVILSQITAIVAAIQPGVPGIAFLTSAHMILLVILLGLSWHTGHHEYAVIGVLPTALAVAFWYMQHGGPELWPHLLLFAAPIYLAFIAYPLLLGGRSGRMLAPYGAAVLASIPFFFQARQAMIQAGWENIIGVLPVAQALLIGLLVKRLLGIEPAGQRSMGRLALVAGAALAFVTVAIPLQLEKEWITIGWALEAAALAWLYRKIPHKGLLYTSAGLFAAVFARLALNPFVLSYEVRTLRIWNWYLYAYLVSAAAFILGSRFSAKTQDSILPDGPRLSKLLPGGAIILLFLLLNIEIADFFSAGPTITFNFTATLAQDLTYTLAWALFGMGLLALGIIVRSQPARVAALALLVATIFKCFIHDLNRLGELYRVVSFVGLGICLALVALALQRFVFSPRKQ